MACWKCGRVTYRIVEGYGRIEETMCDGCVYEAEELDRQGQHLEELVKLQRAAAEAANVRAKEVREERAKEAREERAKEAREERAKEERKRIAKLESELEVERGLRKKLEATTLDEPRAAAFVARAQNCLRVEDHTGALAMAKEALAIDANNAGAHDVLAAITRGEPKLDHLRLAYLYEPSFSRLIKWLDAAPSSEPALNHLADQRGGEVGYDPLVALAAVVRAERSDLAPRILPNCTDEVLYSLASRAEFLPVRTAIESESSARAAARAKAEEVAKRIAEERSEAERRRAEAEAVAKRLAEERSEAEERMRAEARRVADERAVANKKRLDEEAAAQKESQRRKTEAEQIAARAAIELKKKRDDELKAAAQAEQNRFRSEAEERNIRNLLGAMFAVCVIGVVIAAKFNPEVVGPAKGLQSPSVQINSTPSGGISASTAASGVDAELTALASEWAIGSTPSELSNYFIYARNCDIATLGHASPGLLLALRKSIFERYRYAIDAKQTPKLPLPDTRCAEKLKAKERELTRK